MPTTPPTPSSASTKTRGFDKLGFLKYVKDIGRAYRKRAAELVSICRTFVQTQDQTSRSYYELRSALELVDEALMLATKAGKKTSEEADKAFEYAVSRLGYYEWKYHLKDSGAVAKRIKTAEEVDKSSLKFLNNLKEKFRPLEEVQTTKVEFFLHKSLLETPTVAIQALCSKSDQNEILWNFSRFTDERRLTLKQNPHFYKVLPRLPKHYGDKFLMEPTESYLEMTKISVLSDNLGQAGRIFLKTAKKTRAFGNAWNVGNAIIFKDVCGKLEGDSIVGAAIQDTPDLWCFTEPPPSPTCRSSSPSSNISGTSLTTTAASTTSPTGVRLTDWREPIRQMLLSPDVNICISTKPPNNSIRSFTTPSPPISPSGSSSSVGSLPPTPKLMPMPKPTPTPTLMPKPKAMLMSKPPPMPKPAPELTPKPMPKPNPTLTPMSKPTHMPSSTHKPTPTPKPTPMPTRAPGPRPKLKPKPTSLPPQPLSVAPPSTSLATPAQIRHPLPKVTVGRHASSHEAVAEHVPSQCPAPGYQPRVVIPNPPPQQRVPANASVSYTVKELIEIWGG